MKLTDDLKCLYTETANNLRGSDRRLFMTQVVRALGHGGQRLAEYYSPYKVYQTGVIINPKSNATVREAFPKD